MLFIYRLLINLTFFLSPIILIYRLLKKKEDLIRFKEKFCSFSKERKRGKLVWFHGASVGELLSVMPLLKKLERDSKISQILVTSNTLSSSKVLKKYKSKKLVHQFFPIDTNFLSKKFINYWKPSSVFFIDSEIWPNTLNNLKKENIPIILLNGRITKKTFRKWKAIPSFAKDIFSKFDLCLASSYKSKKFLQNLGAKKIKMIGNLKYSQLEDEKIFISKNLKRFFKSKKIWCASSTHETEEIFCGLTHQSLKKKYKNLLTIIIPRHIERVNSIKNDLHKLNLITHTHVSKEKIRNDTDVYIVNSYGKTKSFYNVCKNIFLGGSLVKHGGQNPLEATRFGCNILHGPNVSNFEEIYTCIKEKKISTQIKNQNQMINSIDNFFQKKSNSKSIQKKLKLIGNKILVKTLKEISLYFK